MSNLQNANLFGRSEKNEGAGGTGTLNDRARSSFRTLRQNCYRGSVIHPNARGRLTWDVAAMLLIIFLAISLLARGEGEKGSLFHSNTFRGGPAINVLFPRFTSASTECAAPVARPVECRR